MRIGSLIKNKYFWISVGISLFLTLAAPSSIDSSFATNIPIIIGILVSATFATITLIFGLIANNEVVKLDKDKRQTIEKCFGTFKAHLFLLVSLLVISFLSSYWTSVLAPVLPYFIYVKITVQQVAIFIQVESLLLSVLSIVEMIAVVFDLFHLRWSLLIQAEESNKLTPIKTVLSNKETV